jgi:hypothetical protein
MHTVLNINSSFYLFKMHVYIGDSLMLLYLRDSERALLLLRSP